MKYIALFLFFFVSLIACQQKTTEPMMNKSMDSDVKSAFKTKQLRHVVMFKFKDDADPAGVKKVEDAFAALPSKISEISYFEWGKNNSPENLNKGFTHCFFISFNNEEAREKYLPHPDHKAFVELLGPVLDDVMVMDYWN